MTERTTSERPDPHADEGMVGPHGQPDDHGEADRHDDHGHPGEELGPLDLPMWAAAGLGIVLGLAVLAAFVLALG